MARMTDTNPTVVPAVLLRALRGPQLIQPRHRKLSLDHMVRQIAEERAREAEEAAQAMAEFPRGHHAPPSAVLRALRAE